MPLRTSSSRVLSYGESTVTSAGAPRCEANVKRVVQACADGARAAVTVSAATVAISVAKYHSGNPFRCMSAARYGRSHREPESDMRPVCLSADAPMVLER